MVGLRHIPIRGLSPIPFYPLGILRIPPGKDGLEELTTLT